MSKIRRIISFKQWFTIVENYKQYSLFYTLQIMYNNCNSTRHASASACAPGGSFFINYPLLHLPLSLPTLRRQV